VTADRPGWGVAVRRVTIPHIGSAVRVPLVHQETRMAIDALVGSSCVHGMHRSATGPTLRVPNGHRMHGLHPAI